MWELSADVLPTEETLQWWIGNKLVVKEHALVSKLTKVKSWNHCWTFFCVWEAKAKRNSLILNLSFLEGICCSVIFENNFPWIKQNLKKKNAQTCYVSPWTEQVHKERLQAFLKSENATEICLLKSGWKCFCEHCKYPRRIFIEYAGKIKKDLSSQGQNDRPYDQVLLTFISLRNPVPMKRKK